MAPKLEQSGTVADWRPSSRQGPWLDVKELCQQIFPLENLFVSGTVTSVITTLVQRLAVED